MKKTGKITSLLEEKRFFFIDRDYFCHFNNVQFIPQLDMDVEYEPAIGTNGKKQANRVKAVTSNADIIADYFALLEGGYFDNDGFLKEDFIKKYPERLAKRFQGNPNLNKPTQIRKYFDQVVIIEGRFKVNKQFQYVLVELTKMLPLLHSAKTKKLISEEFYSFLEKNIELAKESEKNFAEGFVQHFQFVIAYY